MANNRGKQFEAKFKSDFINSFPAKTCSIDRLYDSMSGYVSISNISDFIGYKQPHIFYLECKSHEGASFPFSCLSQYDKLIEKVGIPGVRAGVVIWLIDKDKLIYLPIATVTKIKAQGVQSFNPDKWDPTEYKYVNIPFVKKRVFLEGDYSILTTLEDGD